MQDPNDVSLTPSTIVPFAELKLYAKFALSLLDRMAESFTRSAESEPWLDSEWQRRRRSRDLATLGRGGGRVVQQEGRCEVYSRNEQGRGHVGDAANDAMLEWHMPKMD
jgi:hypothetical protein